MVLEMAKYMAERRAHRIRRGNRIPFDALYHAIGHTRPNRLVGQIKHLKQHFKVMHTSTRRFSKKTPLGRTRKSVPIRRKTRRVLYPHPSGHFRHAYFKQFA